MATTTHIKFGDALQVTDEGAGVIRVDGQGATGPQGPAGTSGVIPGGTRGQALTKQSSTDGDSVWSPRVSFPPDGVGGDIVLGGDANLSRVAAAVLRTIGQIQSFQGSAGAFSFSTAVTGDATLRSYTQADGTLQWGNGVAAVDTALYRAAAATLQVISKLIVGATGPVGNAALSAVVDGNAVEFGHSNPAGYRSTVGGFRGSGTAFLLFLGEEGTSAATIRTRGFPAWGLVATPGQNLLSVVTAPAASVDNQTPVVVANFDNGATTSQTGLLLNIGGLGIRRVEVGAPDSGGAGYRMLRVPN